MTMMVGGVVISLDPQLNFEGWSFLVSTRPMVSHQVLGFVFYVVVVMLPGHVWDSLRVVTVMSPSHAEEDPRDPGGCTQAQLQRVERGRQFRG